jgi:Tfp pilus assembly protein PilZ
MRVGTLSKPLPIGLAVKSKEPRMPLVHRAMVVDGEKSVISHAYNLTENGLVVQCDRNWPVDREVKIALSIMGRAMIILSGAIAWRSEQLGDSQHKYKYGIRLPNPPNHYRRYVEAACFLDLRQAKSGENPKIARRSKRWLFRNPSGNPLG